MTVLFTADLHLRHPRVAELRGYISTEHHDLALAAAWREQIRPGDQVWVVGDVTLSALDYALEWLNPLPGYKHLVGGNHDKCHPMHRDSHKWQRRYLGAFESVQPFARRRIAGQSVLLSHFPYRGDSGDEDRHIQYRLPNEGSWLLHGHTHGTERLHDGRQIHVGLDAWQHRLVPLETIEELIRCSAG